MSAARLPLAAAVLALAAACSRSPVAPPAAAAPPVAAQPPEAAQPAAGGLTLCEHRVPAELCTRCDPDLAPVFQDQGDWCAEHGVPESQCLACNPDLTFTATDPAPAPRVRLASPQTVRDAGLETRRAEARPVAKRLEVVGQLDFDQNRLAQVSPRGEALVVEVKVDVGDEVRAGDPLVVLASAAVGADQARLAGARARLDAARAEVAREEALTRDGLSAQKALEAARSGLAGARAEHDAAAAALGTAGATPQGGGGRHVLRAPFAGTVVARDAVAGRTVAAGQVLVQVADLSRMWAQLEVPEADAALVRPGQPVRITFEGQRLAPRDAAVARVAPAVDPATRTVRARVELPDPDHTLKAGVLVRGELQVTASHEAVLVPRAAVQRVEERAVVFVRRGETVFDPVTVETGEVQGELVEVVAGLAVGDEVVTTGAFLLKTEISKASIGAGCCDSGEP